MPTNAATGATVPSTDTERRDSRNRARAMIINAEGIMDALDSDDLADLVDRAQLMQIYGRNAEVAAVRAMRDHGWTWDRIAEATGHATKQAAHARYGAHVEDR